MSRRDIGDFRNACHLATGEWLGFDEAEKLLELLGGSEEALAHILLRRNGFAAYPAILEEIARAARRVPGGRRGEPGDWAGNGDIEDDLIRANADDALWQRIEEDLEAQSRLEDTSVALADLVRRRRPGAFDAQLRATRPIRKARHEPVE